MAKEKTRGICALCRRENIQLMQSHIIPKAAYTRTKSFENSRFRSFYEPKTIYQDGEKKPMLCNDCERFFSKYETKFSNKFLDVYLKNTTSDLPQISEDTEFYVLTVAWRILYDDLYVQNSYPDEHERAYLEEYESKLHNYLYEKLSGEHPELVLPKPILEEVDLSQKCFGEMIAEIEKLQKSQLPEDISEIKNYIFSLHNLGFSDAAVKLFSSMIFGYSFYTPTRTKYYIISGYNGLIVSTAYHRERNILITDSWSLLKKSRSSEVVVKQDIIEEITSMLGEMSSRYAEVQAKLDENGLRGKIAKRYENQKK